MTLIQWLYQCLKAWSMLPYWLYWEHNIANHKVECRWISSDAGPLLMTTSSHLVEILDINRFSCHLSLFPSSPSSFQTPFSLMFPSSFLDDTPPYIPITPATPFLPSMTYFFPTSSLLLSSFQKVSSLDSRCTLSKKQYFESNCTSQSSRSVMWKTMHKGNLAVKRVRNHWEAYMCASKFSSWKCDQRSGSCSCKSRSKNRKKHVS